MSVRRTSRPPLVYVKVRLWSTTKNHISRKFSSGYLSLVQAETRVETRALAASRPSPNMKDYLPELTSVFHSPMRLGGFCQIENFVDYRAQTGLLVER